MQTACQRPFHTCTHHPQMPLTFGLHTCRAIAFGSSGADRFASALAFSGVPVVAAPACSYRLRAGLLIVSANFGPAIQVILIALDAVSTAPIADAISAEQLVIVCNNKHKAVIQSVLGQVGLAARIRDITIKSDLVR